MDNTTSVVDIRINGNILTINTGSTSTKVGYYSDGVCLVNSKIEHSAEVLARFTSIIEQRDLRYQTIQDILASNNIPLQDIDIVMARGGLITPVITGVYEVNDDMIEVLETGRDGVHACNLSAILADNIASQVNSCRLSLGVKTPFGICKAYIADPPMADEMLPECKLGGIPEFSRKTLFHALNSRAVVRRYLKDRGSAPEHNTLIVAHLGGGVTISLHRHGKVIDTTHGLGGDGPITPERAGCCSPFDLIDLCFSGMFTKDEMQKKLVGGGGAVAYFGTNSIVEVQRLAYQGNETAQTFLKAFVLNISKYIAALSATVDGKVDAIILTGGIAYNQRIMDDITFKCSFIAPTVVYPGEDESRSLAEYAYRILTGQSVIHTYDKNTIIKDNGL